MKLTRRITLGLMAAFSASPAFAAKPSVFVGNNGFAINGFDPVAYFKVENHVMGLESHASSHNGATFLFSSPENKAAFDADPDSFAPQYGGYCAYAVSKGSTAKSDPDAWTIVDGKLYLNFNLQVRDIWRQDIAGNITKADANWPNVLG